MANNIDLTAQLKKILGTLDRSQVSSEDTEEITSGSIDSERAEAQAELDSIALPESYIKDGVPMYDPVDSDSSIFPLSPIDGIEFTNREDLPSNRTDLQDALGAVLDRKQRGGK